MKRDADGYYVGYAATRHGIVCRDVKGGVVLLIPLVYRGKEVVLEKPVGVKDEAD